MRWVVGPGVRWMSVDDDIVIFVPAVGGFVDLDASGAELWCALHAADMDDAGVEEHLRRAHGVEPDHASRIVGDFLADLVRLGAVTPSRSSRSSAAPHERDGAH